MAPLTMVRWAFCGPLKDPSCPHVSRTWMELPETGRAKPMTALLRRLHEPSGKASVVCMRIISLDAITYKYLRMSKKNEKKFCNRRTGAAICAGPIGLAAACPRQDLRGGFLRLPRRVRGRDHRIKAAGFHERRGCNPLKNTLDQRHGRVRTGEDP